MYCYPLYFNTIVCQYGSILLYTISRLFIHLSIDIYCCFWVLTIVNKISMNICICLFVNICFKFSWANISELNAGSYDKCMFNFFFFLPQPWHVEVHRQGIKPEPQQWPEPQQLKCCMLNWLSHKGTPFFLVCLTFKKIQNFIFHISCAI